MGTSPKAFSNVLNRLRQSQATNLIRLKYALLSNPTSASVTLMENINTIGFGIHLLLGKILPPLSLTLFSRLSCLFIYPLKFCLGM